jgi:hypothetical protein
MMIYIANIIISEVSVCPAAVLLSIHPSRRPSRHPSIHPSSSSRKKKMMEEDDDDDKWRQ